MKNTLIKYLAVAASVVVLFGSCRKDSFQGEQSEGKGASFVRIFDGPLKANFFDAFSDVKTTGLFTIRRDAATNAELKKTITVSLKDLGQTYLNKYNNEHATTYEIMPSSVYALGDGLTKTAAGVNVSIPSGSDVEKFVVKLNGAKLDPAKKYALAYVIESADGLATKAGKDTIIATVGVKNKYDGTYAATGLFVRVGLDQRDIDQLKNLVTVNANTVSSTVADLGDGLPLLLTVNGDNSVTVTFPDVTQAQLPGAFTQEGVNKYDPATKTFTLHYQYRDKARTTEEKLVLK